MTDHVYKLVDLVGTSSESIERAIENAIARASQTTRNLRWFQVSEVRGHVDDGRVAHYQVVVKAAFTIESPDDD
jgi:flavin-binding protein dodecin